MNYKELIKMDLYRYYGSNHIKPIIKNRLYGWRYMKTWRKAKYYNDRNSKLYYLFGFILYKKSLKYGFQISPHATIGEGFYLGHFGTIIIGNDVRIGKNCNISPNVIIGRTNRGERKGSPIIGNDVWLGSGAIIVGKIKIGDNVLIAPNSYVNVDVPSNSIVVGNPASISFRHDATQGYINNKV